MSSSSSIPQQGGAPESYSVTARLLTTAVLCTVFVLVLLIVLHLYIRFVVNRRGPTSRRAAILSYIMSEEASNTETAVVATGLGQAAIDMLPTFPYKKDGNSGVGPECTICLSAVGEGEMVRILPSCKHVFHTECIDMWLGSHCTCPVCRAEVEGEERGRDDLGFVGRLGSSLRRIMSWDRSGRRVQAGVASLGV